MKYLRSSTILFTLLFIALAALALITHNRYVLTILIFSLIASINTVGLNLLMGYAGQISIGQAGFFAIGAYFSALLTMLAAVPYWLSPILSVMIGAIVGYGLGFPALRVRGHYLAIVTLAFGQIVVSIIGQMPFLTGGYSGLAGISRPTVAGFTFDTDRSYALLVIVVTWLVFVASSNLIASRIGRALEAIKSSEVGAASVGVSVSRLKVKIFALSGALSALAGVLYAHYVQFLSPSDFSVVASVSMLAMVLVGGLASIPGSIAGAFLLTVLPELFKNYQDWEGVLVALVIVLIVMFMPSGLVPGFWQLLVHGRNPFTLPPPLAQALTRFRNRAHSSKQITDKRG